MNSVNKTLIKANNKLKNHSSSASLDAEVLLAHILKVNKAWLLSHPKYKLNLWQTIKYSLLIRKRIKNWPIAYLTGSHEFYGFKFKVNKHTLVPRPESELFIDELKKINPTNQIIADIGTGSGCLIITAAKLLPNNIFVASDISKQALKIAKQNATDHSVNIKFVQSDLLDSFDIKNSQFDILLANLPYLTPEQMKEPSIQREPKQALIAGDDGLKYYKKLLEQINKLTHKPKHIFFEINPEQTKLLIRLIKNLLSSFEVKKILDLSDKTRLLKIY